MTNKVHFPIYWDKLPDPRPSAANGATTMIEVQEAEWRKVVKKHLANSSEPWTDTLGSDILGAVVNSEDSAATRHVLDLLRKQCARSMGRPLGRVDIPVVRKSGK